MQVSEAIELVNGISYKPGWHFSAYDAKRFQDTINLSIRYPVPNSDAKYAPDYSEPVFPIPMMDFWLAVHDCNTATEFFGKVLECLMQIERHETREFFGVYGTEYSKPFHPHTVEGMTNWANRKPVIEAEDITLGVMAYV